MELKHLKTFTVIAEVHGFTKAAEALGYVQSSVTAQIQSLEEELESPLFDRLGKTVVLTDTGRRLLPYAHEMLRLQTSVKELVQTNDIPAGTLTIGAPESLAAYRLPEVIKEYKRLYSQVRIILKPALCWELRNQVRNGQTDVAFVLEPDTQAADLHIERLVEERMVLVAPPDHRLVGQGEVVAADLVEETFLHTEPGCSYRDLFERYLQQDAVVPSAAMEFWSIEAIKNCVMSGLGIAVLPLIAVNAELQARKLAALKWDDAEVRVSTQMVYHRAKWISPTLREFIRMVKAHAEGWNAE